MKTKNLLKSLKRRLSWMLCLMAFLTVGQNAVASNPCIHGNFDGSWKDWNLSSGKVTISLSANTSYEFSIKNNNGDWKINNGTMNRSNCTSWKFEGGKSNAHITADIAGDYVFNVTNTSGDPVLSVTYPDIILHVVGNGSGKGSWCCGKDWDNSECSMDGAYPTASKKFENVSNNSDLQFKITGGSWGFYEYGYNNWDKDTSETNGATVSESSGNVKISTSKVQHITISLANDKIHIKCEDACTDPTVTTTAATNVGTTTATLGGSYTGGSATPTEVGIEWTSGTTGSIAASSVSSSFTVNATGLTAGTTYKYKAYAKACGGNKVYGSEQTFKTTCTATKPTVSTVAATGVGTNVATVGCNVTNAGVKADCSAETITARGIEWTQGKSGQESIGSGTGSSTKQITGLTPGTEYKYMAFATNASGTSYGEENSFTTLGVHGDITGLPASPVAKCSGEELQLAPQCSTATSWSYNSDATGVATVTDAGIITAIGAGSAVITVTAKADNYIDKSVQITVNVSASPAVSASSNNTTAYEVITLTSTSGSVTWSKSDAAAYFVKDNQAVDGDTVDAESVNFKAPAKVGDYTVGATSNGCTSNLSITISTPTEVCN